MDQGSAPAPLDRHHLLDCFATLELLFSKEDIFEMPRRFIQYPYHVSAFFILNFLFSRWLFSARTAQSPRKIEMISLIGCVFVSIGSEIIQLFVPTRTPAVTDLGLDLIGALLALLLARRYPCALKARP